MINAALQHDIHGELRCRALHERDHVVAERPCDQRADGQVIATLELFAAADLEERPLSGSRIH